MADTLETQAALFDFVEQWNEDRRSGTARNLQEYLGRFPGHEVAIAREYLRLADSSGSRGAGGAGEPAAIRTAPRTGNPSLQELLARLQAPRRTLERYEGSTELARGGMGAIVKVRDRDLRREVAMKVMLGRGPRQVARFLEEARVTGQLEHPGILPVHDLGVDGDGRVFFTMRLVEGRDLREVIELVHAGQDRDEPEDRSRSDRDESGGWSLTRVLEVLLKVCDTVAYAHAQGVVHRDLKPSNVRVGGFGEVYVMDWGLARVGSGMESEAGPGIDSERGAERSRPSDSPILTREGDVVGTPSYMAPEQAEGRNREVGPPADVYAVGAMLYHLLAGSPPYTDQSGSLSSDTVLALVRRGPPGDLRGKRPESLPTSQRRDAPAELVSICTRAMARDPDARYPSLREMAADLRAYLEGRVVRAHRTGAWVELAKWTARNRALATSLASALALGIGLFVVVAVLGSKGRARLQLLADARAPAALLARAREIVPTGPEQVEPLERWLTEARDLVARRDGYARELEELRSRALPFDAEHPREKAAHRLAEDRRADIVRVRDFYRDELARVEREGGLSRELMPKAEVEGRLNSFEAVLRAAETASLARQAWIFADPEDQLRFETLTALLPALSAFLDSPGAEGWITRLERRLQFARTVEERTIVGARAAWEAAAASIRDEGRCPLYRGLEIRPQLGLVPLRRDPASGLWEFLHLQSGAAPELDPDEDVGGRWRLREDTGILLVLIPGGEFAMGAQAEDPHAPNYDPQAEPEESARSDKGSRAFPGHLEPYFLSKYEVTQAQWRRLAGRDPSSGTSAVYPEHVRSRLHPAESVRWTDAQHVLEEVGLRLPSEARWEYAARAGTSTPWWTGSARDSLSLAANLADRCGAANGAVDLRECSEWPECDDGWAFHAPVGSLRANPFGLLDTAGNVAEWCSDTGFVSYDHWTETHFGDLERRIWSEGLRLRRGGSYASRAASLRSAARAFSGPEDARPDTGLRPARDLH